MKHSFLIIFISYCFSNSLSAQLESKKQVDRGKHDLKIAIPDTSYNGLFSEWPTLKSIYVGYKDDQPYDVFIHFENDGPNFSKRQHYDLAFEGDAYVLEKKYGPIHLVNPKVNIQSTWTNRGTRVDFTIEGISIIKDSIFYRGNETRSDGVINGYTPDNILGMPARYKGDLKLRENKLAEEYAKIEAPAEIDSIVVFQGTVNKRGSLYDMTLIAGRRSVFSDLIHITFVPAKDKFELLPPREDWFPAVIDRGPIETKIRIYARLNKDGSVTLKTPRRLRTFTGE